MTVGVLLLTQAECALCEHAKGVLDRVARDFPLEIRVLDLGTEEGASLAAAVGMAFPPGVVIDGVAFSHGRLSERRLRRELTRRAKIAPSSPVAGPPLATSADPEAPEPEGPALIVARRFTGRLTGRRRWPFNLPRPGQRVANLDLDDATDARSSGRAAGGFEPIGPGT